MLVYEYVNNGNLEQWLHGDVGPCSPLTWEIRMNIIRGTAKGYDPNWSYLSFIPFSASHPFSILFLFLLLIHDIQIGHSCNLTNLVG